MLKVRQADIGHDTLGYVLAEDIASTHHNSALLLPHLAMDGYAIKL